MAGNPLMGIFRVKELRERILFTLLMLVVFRLGAVLPIPGININALKAYFLAQQNSGNAIIDYLIFLPVARFLIFSVFMSRHHAVYLHVYHHATLFGYFPQFKENIRGRGRTEKNPKLSADRYRSGLYHPILRGYRMG